MTRRVTKVQQATFRQKNQTVTVWHLDHIDLLFDVRPFVVLQRSNLDFVIKVTDVTNDRHVFHFAHVFDADHVFVASCCDKDIRSFDDIIQCGDLEAIHGCLKCADWVNFGNNDTSTSTCKGRSRTFANIAITHDNSNFTGHHCVCRAADAVDQRLFTAVLVVELGFGYRVIHVDRRERQLTVLVQIIKAVNASCCFFGNALNFGFGLCEPAWCFFHALSDLNFDRFFFFGLRHRNDVFACFCTCTQKNVQCSVATIVKDHVCPFREHEGFV